LQFGTLVRQFHVKDRRIIDKIRLAGRVTDWCVNNRISATRWIYLSSHLSTAAAHSQGDAEGAYNGVPRGARGILHAHLLRS
jgi:hypothetical protein